MKTAEPVWTSADRSARTSSIQVSVRQNSNGDFVFSDAVLDELKKQSTSGVCVLCSWEEKWDAEDWD